MAQRIFVLHFVVGGDFGHVQGVVMRAVHGTGRDAGVAAVLVDGSVGAGFVRHALMAPLRRKPLKRITVIPAKAGIHASYWR
jgi:hypothetical protein